MSRLTAEESVYVTAAMDDPEMRGRISTIASLLDDLPDETVREMFAGFLIGGIGHEKATKLMERMVALAKQGIDEEKGSA